MLPTRAALLCLFLPGALCICADTGCRVVGQQAGGLGTKHRDEG